LPRPRRGGRGTPAAHRRQGFIPQPSSYIVELTSTEVEIGEFIANVAAFGQIVEVVRSGVLESRARTRDCTL